jgi:hypothetical protein
MFDLGLETQAGVFQVNKVMWEHGAQKEAIKKEEGHPMCLGPQEEAGLGAL